MKRLFRKIRLLIILLGLFSIGCSDSQSFASSKAGNPALKGEWLITRQTITPLTIIPLCRLLKKGALFKFTENTLEVYPDASGKPCAAYNYKATGATVSFIKEDMIWLCTYELDEAELKLTSNNFFTSDNLDKSAAAINNQTGAAQDIVVLLKKR